MAQTPQRQGRQTSNNEAIRKCRASQLATTPRNPLFFLLYKLVIVLKLFCPETKNWYYPLIARFISMESNFKGSTKCKSEQFTALWSPSSRVHCTNWLRINSFYNSLGPTLQSQHQIKVMIQWWYVMVLRLFSTLNLTVLTQHLLVSRFKSSC